jgi:hypothetical protein
MPRVILFHWNREEGAARVRQLSQAGFEAELHTEGGGLSLRAMAGALAAVIDLTRLPSHGRAVAAWLRGSKSTRQIPIIFVDGEPEKITRVKQDVPDAAFVASKQLLAALKKAKAPADPVIPRQMMHSTRSTAQKLGIRENARVLLIDPPSNYLKVLGTLPAGVEFLEEAGAKAEVTLWFVLEPESFERALPARRKLAAQSKLWIVWKKGNPKGLNGNRVREAAMAMGLVDYKICSLDGVWSGIALSVKN